MLTESRLAKAAAELSLRHPELGAVYRTYGVPPLWDRPAGFATLLHIILEQQVSLASAKACFDKLAAKQPSAVGPPTMAGLILQVRGKDAEARKRYERLVEKDPHAAVASNNLAYAYATHGEQLDRALQLAQAAVDEMKFVV